MKIEGKFTRIMQRSKEIIRKQVSKYAFKNARSFDNKVQKININFQYIEKDYESKKNYTKNMF